MKLPKSIALFLTVIVLSASTYKTIEGFEFKDEITIGKEKLILNGLGLREKYWFDLYVAGLYLKSKSDNATKIINLNETKVLHIKMVSSMVTSEKFIAATDEGFINSAGSQIDSIKTQITLFKSIFKDEAIVENDEFKLISIPGKGIKVEKNGTLKKTISGELFSQALFGIWLCGEPADEDLKKGLLGK